MRQLLDTILMIVGPFCLWYGIFIMVCAEWNAGNWHWAARSVWAFLSIVTMIRIFKKFGR